MAEKRRNVKMDKAKLKKILIILGLVLLLLIIGVIALKKKVGKEFASKDSEGVLSATAEKSSISTSVYGTGQLTDDDVEETNVPDGIEITEYKASVGDSVKKGDVLAEVDDQSVVSSISSVQSQIDELDEKLEDAEDDEISSTVKAKVSGRVKKIYAKADEKVASVMYENNSLMDISTDGYMAVDFEAEGLNEGDETTVIGSDDKEYTGKVKCVIGDNVTVIFSDDGPEVDEKVTVNDASGNEVGSGKCYINSPVTVIGYGGTVSSISVSENSYVSEGTTLITLKDTEDTIESDVLLKERKELEEDLANLMNIYKNGAICASISGSVKSLPDTDSKKDSDSNNDEEESAGFSISPDKTMTVFVSVDETDILAVEVGQKVDITIDSVGEDVYEGTVTEINKSGTSSDGVTSYTASVQIDKQEGMLEGMTAEANIKIEGVEDAIVVPVDAVNETSSSAFVYTTYDEETGELGGMVEVTTGLSNSNYIEIKEGLAKDDIVYYEDKSKKSSGSDFGKGGPGKSDFGGSSAFPGGSGKGSDSGFTPPSGGTSGASSFPGGGN